MAPDTDEYEAGLTVIGEFETVETFCRYFNWLKPPSKLERNSNYHLFKSGIKPMWEDEANANGGKWVLTMKQNPQLLDRCWMWLAMALIGEDLDDGDEICGAVVSLIWGSWTFPMRKGSLFPPASSFCEPKSFSKNPCTWKASSRNA